MNSQPLYFDQYDYAIDNNPYDILKRLRDEAPVWYNEKYDYWMLTRYDDVQRASLDTETFSSACNTVLEMMTDKPSDSTMMINNDPPYHDRLRAIITPFFSPARVVRLEDEIRSIVLGYLERLESRDQFDFVEDFARWIPMDVISMILGIPTQDRREINEWANDFLHRDEGQVEESASNIKATDNLSTYFDRLMLDRRQSPDDDIASAISNGRIAEGGSERPLSELEASEFLQLIGAAGNETVARLLGSAGWLLAKYPEQRDKLRSDPSLIPQAVEELLRFEAPSPTQFRRVMKDVEIHGVRIPAGSTLCLNTASAGRDERQYDNPELFNVERVPRRHVTFGYGKHACLGANVARLEIRIALEEVLRRIPDWEVDEAGIRRVRTSTVRGFSHVPAIVIRN